MTSQTRKQTGNGTPGSFASAGTSAGTSASARYADDKPAWKTECGGCGNAHRTVKQAAICAFESSAPDGFVPDHGGDDGDLALVARNPGAAFHYGVGVSYRDRGQGGRGRNVNCRTCYQKSAEAYDAGETSRKPARTVWFTNESRADVPARNAAIAHTAGHIREDAAQDSEGTPGALTSRKTFLADYARSTRALQAVGAIETLDDGTERIDETISPDLAAYHRRLTQFGYANGLM